MNNSVMDNYKKTEASLDLFVVKQFSYSLYFRASD